MNRRLVAQNLVARPRIVQLESREADVAASLEESAAQKAGFVTTEVSCRPAAPLDIVPSNWSSKLTLLQMASTSCTSVSRAASG